MPLRFTSLVRMLSREDGLQAFEFEILRAAVHAIGDFGRGSLQGP